MYPFTGQGWGLCVRKVAIPLSAGQSKGTPDLTPNGGLYRKQYQNGFKLRIEIILNPVNGILCLGGF